jgi:class 3 adenylate cyclase
MTSSPSSPSSPSARGSLRCFLFTDIEGSTSRWEASATDMATRLEHHDRTARETFARHGGSVFATGGDGFAVVFSDVGAALDAAVEMQAVSVDTGLLVRAGLHIGSAVEGDDDFFGPAVNRTARLMAVGHGGQVLLSEAAAAVERQEREIIAACQAPDFAADRLKSTWRRLRG